TGSTADMLHVGGAVTGKTTIIVADTNADTGGLTGASGITLVTSGSALPTDAFTLGAASTVKGGSVETVNGVTVLHKGFFDYALANPTPTTLALVSAPSISAAEAPLVAVGAKTIWYQTAVDYQNRLAGTISDVSDRVGFWGQGIGSWTRRSDSAPE